MIKIYYNKTLFLIFIFSILTIYLSCDKTKIFENNQTIENKQWAYNQPIIFKTIINDTTLRYNLYINVRTSENYAYQNMWVSLSTQTPKGNTMQSRIDLPLADNEGKWLGSGFGDVITTQIQVPNRIKFSEIGEYTFNLVQDMRENPLKEVLSAGMRLEINTQKK